MICGMRIVNCLPDNTVDIVTVTSNIDFFLYSVNVDKMKRISAANNNSNPNKLDEI